MKRFLTAAATSLCLMLPLMAAPAYAETPREEGKEHPRIAKAIHEMEDALAYMEAAPHDFGGHKAAAMKATREAVEQLRLALQFRAAVDTKHGKP
jgi:hypothetical protein